jgi:hypothetical protein
MRLPITETGLFFDADEGAGAGAGVGDPTSTDYYRAPTVYDSLASLNNASTVSTSTFEHDHAIAAVAAATAAAAAAAAAGSPRRQQQAPRIAWADTQITVTGSTRESSSGARGSGGMSVHELIRASRTSTASSAAARGDESGRTMGDGGWVVGADGSFGGGTDIDSDEREMTATSLYVPIQSPENESLGEAVFGDDADVVDFNTTDIAAAAEPHQGADQPHALQDDWELEEEQVTMGGDNWEGEEGGGKGVGGTADLVRGADEDWNDQRDTYQNAAVAAAVGADQVEVLPLSQPPTATPAAATFTAPTTSTIPNSAPTPTIPTISRAAAAPMPFARLHKAATVIQAAWRGFVVRRWDMQCATIRREIRTKRAEKQINMLMHSNATIAEKVQRGEQIERVQQEAIRLLWGEVRALMAERTRHTALAENKAAGVIQRYWRGYSARKVWGPALRHRLLDNMSGVQRLRAAVHAGNTTALVELCLHLQDQVDSLNLAMTKVTGPDSWHLTSPRSQQYPSGHRSRTGSPASPSLNHT